MRVLKIQLKLVNEYYYTFFVTSQFCKAFETDMDDAVVKQEFLSYFQTSGLPSQDKWPEGSPVFLAASQRAPNIKYDLPPQESHSLSPFPLDGTSVSFEGPIFKGKIVSRIKSDSNPNISSRGNSYFKGKSRLFQWTVQG